MRVKFTILGCLISVLSPAALCSAEQVWVQIRNSMVRSSPEYFAAAVAPVKYGDPLTMISVESNWVKVKTAAGQTGYLPNSAVSAKVVALSVKDATKSKADPSDIVLAGKGFSKEVEGKYRQGADAGRYDLVDKVEKASVVGKSEVAQFVKAGGLKG